MEFLRFLAIVAVWGFMWRWVVKNRGSWNIFYGNIVGAAGGFIVAMVVLSITLSLFPSSHDYEAAQAENTQVIEPTSLLPEAEAVTPAAELKDAPAFAAIEPDDKPSPPTPHCCRITPAGRRNQSGYRPCWIKATIRGAWPWQR